jgi:D-serine deaminase-like pyridoxal phosphate-dependent protein
MSYESSLAARVRPSDPSSPSIYDDLVATPFVYVDTAIVRANILRTSEATQKLGLELRPHIKTHKIAEIARWQLEAGATGLSVAKIGEAEALANAGVIASYLIAHPFWGSAHIDRFLALQEACPLIASVDSLAAAGRLSAAAQRADTLIEISLVVDTGYGRFGVGPDEAPELAQAIASLPHLRLIGIRSHAGHVYGEPSIAARRAIAEEEVLAITKVAERLREQGTGLDAVSIGSTPGLRPLLDLPALGSVSELRPGNYVFFDRQQCSMGVASLEDCALTIVTTVVSAPRPGTVILDAGKLTLSSTDDPLADGYGLIKGFPDAVISSLSQECATVATRGHDLPLGTRVSVIPNHACEITNLAREVYFGTDERIVGAWNPEAARCSG